MHPFEKFEEMMLKRMSEDGVSFDPAIIIQLLTVLLPLLAGCFNTTPRNLRRRFGNRARVAVGIMGQMNVTWTEAFQLADKVFDVADKASDADLAAFAKCCRDGVGQ